MGPHNGDTAVAQTGSFGLQRFTATRRVHANLGVTWTRKAAGSEPNLAHGGHASGVLRPETVWPAGAEMAPRGYGRVRGKHWTSLFRLTGSNVPRSATRASSLPESVGLPARCFRELLDCVPTDNGRVNGMSAPIPTG